MKKPASSTHESPKKRMIVLDPAGIRLTPTISSTLEYAFSPAVKTLIDAQAGVFDKSPPTNLSVLAKMMLFQMARLTNDINAFLSAVAEYSNDGESGQQHHSEDDDDE